MHRHLCSIRDLSPAELFDLFQLAERIQEDGWHRGNLPHTKHGIPIMATLFFEPSTRTRLSFEAAMLKLGGQVISAPDSLSSSTSKGESIADTVRVVSEYADVIVLRHQEKGMAKLAAAHSGDTPIINGGDGIGEHPTQSLCDLFALWQAMKKQERELKDARVVVFGDLQYSRAAHSFVTGLKMVGATVFEVPHGGNESDHVPPDIDATYITRPQLERHALRHRGLASERGAMFDLVPDVYGKRAHEVINQCPKAFIMHPLPRTGEVSKDLDDDPRSIYFEQAKAGVPIRMVVVAALLGIVQLGEEEDVVRNDTAGAGAGREVSD